LIKCILKKTVPIQGITNIFMVLVVSKKDI